MTNYNCVVVGTLIKYDKLSDEIKEKIEESDELGVFVSSDYTKENYKVLGRKVVGPSSNHTTDHKQDLLSSYRKHRPKVERKLEDLQLFDRDFEVSMYFIINYL